ncbi:hypothetical protein [Georgenia yuyongxinii]
MRSLRKPGRTPRASSWPREIAPSWLAAIHVISREVVVMVVTMAIHAPG